MIAAAGAAALGGALVALPASANGHSEQFNHRTIHGTVVSDDGTTLVLTNRSGTHTILLTPDTKYSETGDPNPVTTATPGQWVAVKIVNYMAAPSSGSSSSNSSSSSSSNSSSNPTFDPVAGRVTILLESVSGVVTNLSGTTVTLSGEEGRTKTVDVSGADIYQRTRAADGTWTTTPATLAVNDLVTAFGRPDKTTPSTFDASFVKVRGVVSPESSNDDAAPSTGASSSSQLKPAVTGNLTPVTAASHETAASTDREDEAGENPSEHWVKGTVASASNGVIVIDQADGSQVTVTTTDSTKYRTSEDRSDSSGSASPGSSSTTPGFSGIAPKDRILAEVTPSGSALDALVVYYSAPDSDADHSGTSDHPDSGPSGSTQTSGDQYGQHQYPSNGGQPSGTYSDNQGGSYGGDGSYGGGQSSRH